MAAARSAVGTSLGVAAAAGLAALAWGTLVERTMFTTRRETFAVLPPGARPITILHLSDLHLAPWQEKKIEWVRSLAAVRPDLVVNTGDNLGHDDAYEALEYALAPFQDVPGVFVNGSNDYFGPMIKNPFGYFAGPSKDPSTQPKQATELDTPRMERYFEDALGWVNLNNAADSIEINGSRIEFFGVNDAHRNWDKLGVLPRAIDEMRENVDWQEGLPADLTIGVTHAPYQRVLNSFVTNGADVILAGHTHGGQVRIPGMPALVTNCDIPRAQASGISLWNHARSTAILNVSAGIGTSIYAPVRFACRPEAVVVTLTPAIIGYP